MSDRCGENCHFRNLLSGALPCVLLEESPSCAAVLEPAPLTAGHTLVFPKRCVDGLFDLDENELAELMRFCRRIAQSLKHSIPCEKIGLSVYGLKVRHAHLHLIPLHGVPGEMSLDRPRKTAAVSELETIADAIRTGRTL